ncbi:spore coat protein [Halobacillus sp. B23F22_1]|uniref:spore coat protein n=1 Tax=Halobacillus sp. B23F22_1 TaxID=3459514 RepID=UPI00373F9AB4
MEQQLPNNNPQSSSNIPASMSHGGHELFDAHEVIASVISLLDQYQLYDQHMQDEELKQIASRQSSFLTELYNIMVECLQTGAKPSQSTHVYKMEQNNDVTYGMKPTKPKKPNQSINDLSDQGLSAYMLGQTKGLASLMAMTALEMTNPVLRRVIADSVPNLIEMSYEVFLYQNKHGYYQVPQLAPQDIAQMTNSYAPATNQGLH